MGVCLRPLTRALTHTHTCTCTITQAYASGQLDRNDIMLKVDGVVATNDNILRLLVLSLSPPIPPHPLLASLSRSLARSLSLSLALSRSRLPSLSVSRAHTDYPPVTSSPPSSHNLQVGDDVPGSELTLTVQKGGKAGNVRVVKLQRIATERIADRRRMFELFTLIKARGSELQDDKIPSTVDKCISTWTNMLVADAYHQQKATKRFKSLQEQCIRWLDQLCQDLPAQGCDSHGMQKPASAHASPLDVGNISLLLGQMRTELLDAADILRKCIDEESLREISTGEICVFLKHVAHRRQNNSRVTAHAF